MLKWTAGTIDSLYLYFYPRMTSLSFLGYFSTFQISGNLALCAHISRFFTLSPPLPINQVRASCHSVLSNAALWYTCIFPAQFRKSTIKVNAFQEWGQPERDVFLEVFGLCLTLFCNVKLKAIRKNIKRTGFCCKQVYMRVCVCICVHVWASYDNKINFH